MSPAERNSTNFKHDEYTAPVYGIYVSQLIRYFRPCISYHDVPERGLLLTRKPLNQEFHVVKLKSSFRQFNRHHHELVYHYWMPVHIWQRVWSNYCYHIPVLFSSLWPTWLIIMGLFLNEQQDMCHLRIRIEVPFHVTWEKPFRFLCCVITYYISCIRQNI